MKTLKELYLLNHKSKIDILLEQRNAILEKQQDSRPMTWEDCSDEQRAQFKMYMSKNHEGVIATMGEKEAYDQFGYAWWYSSTSSGGAGKDLDTGSVIKPPDGEDGGFLGLDWSTWMLLGWAVYGGYRGVATLNGVARGRITGGTALAKSLAPLSTAIFYGSRGLINTILRVSGNRAAVNNEGAMLATIKYLQDPTKSIATLSKELGKAEQKTLKQLKAAFSKGALTTSEASTMIMNDALKSLKAGGANGITSDVIKELLGKRATQAGTAEYAKYLEALKIETALLRKDPNYYIGSVTKLGG